MWVFDVVPLPNSFGQVSFVSWLQGSYCATIPECSFVSSCYSDLLFRPLFFLICRRPHFLLCNVVFWLSLIHLLRLQPVKELGCEV
jgi:hypothetical protein